MCYLWVPNKEVEISIPVNKFTNLGLWDFSSDSYTVYLVLKLKYKNIKGKVFYSFIFKSRK